MRRPIRYSKWRSACGGVEGQRRRRAVAQQVDVAGGFRTGRDPGAAGADHECGPAADVDPGGRGDQQVHPAARGDQHPAVAHVGRADDVVPVDGHGPEGAAADPRVQGAVVGVEQPDPDRCAGRGLDRGDAGAAGDRAPTGVGVHRRRDVLGVVRGDRQDDQRAEQPAAHLGVRDLVRVVPVGAGVLGDEPVDVPAAGPDGVLGDPRDAVLGVGHVDPVPVQRHPVGHVDVGQRDLHQIALVRHDRRPRRTAVQRVSLHPLAAGQLERPRPRGQVDRDVRLAVGRPGQVGDADPGGTVLVRRAAAVVDVAHVHDGVRRRHEARGPVPAERTQGDDGHDGGNEYPPAAADGVS